MKRKVCILIFLSAGILLCSCASLHPAAAPKPLQEDEGLVFVYLQPLPSEAGRLAFSIGSISAVRDDGREFPLSLRLTELSGKGLTRQRLLCSGSLPEGSYTGFSVTIPKATLSGEEGATLLVPDAAVPAAFPFRVAAQKAQVVFADLNYAKSLAGGISFSPVFALYAPPRPVTAVLGYVSDYASQAVTVFDKNSPKAVAAIATGQGPRGLALDQQQRRIYVALADSDAVQVVDATTGDELHRVRLNFGDRPLGLALMPDGRSLLVLNSGSNSVSVVDTSFMVETARIPVGNGPAAILLDRAGRRAYVFNSLASTLSVIDVANHALAATLATDPAPVWGQFSPQGDRLYILCAQSPYMTVFDPARLTVLSRVFVGTGVDALKVDPATGLIYAGRSTAPGIEIYDPSLLAPIDTIATAGGTSYMTIDNEANNLWIVAAGTGRLTAVNLTSRKVVSEIDVGEEPSWLVMAGER